MMMMQGAGNKLIRVVHPKSLWDMVFSSSSESNIISDENVEIVDVWTHNLEYEFSRIRAATNFGAFISIDTEFPGTVIHPTKPNHSMSSSERYKLMKANVDSLHLIQLGFTITNLNGDIPAFGGHRVVWQFNFKDFDISSDRYSSDSIELLKKQGIDFEKNRREGVDSLHFCKLLFSSGLVFHRTNWFRWITFHGAYDFAYLLKVLTRKPLPDDLAGFYMLMSSYFGVQVYDLKQIIKSYNGVYGGLERVAGTYGVKRRTGNAHRAGSDSLLTWNVFQKIIPRGTEKVEGASILFGLDIDPKPATLAAPLILGSIVLAPFMLPVSCGLLIVPVDPGFTEMQPAYPCFIGMRSA